MILFPWISPAVRRNAIIDVLAAVLYGVFGGLTTPFIPFMARRLGGSPLEVSVLIASQGIVLLLSLWFANLIRTAHSVRLVVIPAFLARMLLLVMPAIHTPEAYVIVILLHYTIASIATLGYAQVMRAIYPAEARGRIMAVVRVGMAVAWIIASLVGGRGMQLVPFQWVFAVAGLFGMASSAVFSRISAPAVTLDTERIDAARTWRVLQENRSYRRFLWGMFVFGVGAWFFGPAVPILLVDQLHATSFQAGLLGAITSTMWLLSYYAWGRTIDRRTAGRIMSTVLFIGMMSPLIYLVSTNAWIVQLAGVSEGLTSAGMDLAWLTAVLEHAPEGQVRHYVAIYNTLVGIRGSTAPFLTGVLIPVIGIRWIFAIAAALMATGAVIMRAGARSAGSRMA